MKDGGRNFGSTPPKAEPRVYDLPNGMTIHHVNKHETDFLYQEIFVEKTYFKNGVTLQEKPCVFDVGANIGMFSLFVKRQWPEATLYAFEPIPALYEILSLNVGQHGQSVKTYPMGVSDRIGEANLVYYPGYSIMSGFHADESKDAGILSSSLRLQISQSAIKRKEVSDEHIQQMAKFTLNQKIEFKCPMTTLAKTIREAGVKKIDLLKVDAEKSELAVLAGLENDDWTKIKQIVMEVHSPEDLEVVQKMLRQRGFAFIIQQADQLANSGIFNCFAFRE